MSKKYFLFLLVAALFFVSFPGMSVKYEKQENELDLQISELKNLKQAGGKLGLVIGRSSIDQSFFSSEKKKTIWSYGTLPYKKDAIGQTALKLNFDFSDSQDLKRLEALFSAVVIDRFSWNFLQGESTDFMIHCSKLLEKNSESCIFFEAVPNMVFLHNGNEDGVHYSPYFYKTPFSWFSCAQSDGARTFDLMRQTLEENMLSKTKNHLMELFESVTTREFIVHDLFYTQENKHEDLSNSKLFFVLKRPVDVQNNFNF